VDELAKFSVDQLGAVDLWINNAGTISSKKEKLADLSQEEIAGTVTTNLVGSLLCTQAALKLMTDQGYGHIFNMDGAGATGDATPLYAAYGSTKAALVQLTKTLCEESKETGVGVHLLSPGMVITDLLLTGATPENLGAFNILAELPENVSSYLVPRIRSVEGSGQYIRYLTNVRVIGRLLTFAKRWDRFFDKDGNRMYKPEDERLIESVEGMKEPLPDTPIDLNNLTVAYVVAMGSLFVTLSKILNTAAFAQTDM
jgi:chlorophyll(ide) b reductase